MLFQLLYTCRYGGRMKESRSRDIRPNQRTVKLGCKAFIRFYRRINGTYKLTAFDEEHTKHNEGDEDVYNQETINIKQEHYDTIETLLAGFSKPRQIKNALETKHNLNVDINKVRHVLKKLALPENDSERLEKLLKSITEEGGVVKIFEENGDIQALTVTSNKMKNAFRGTEPNVVNIDTTFNVEENGYKLNACLYLNPVTKKGEIAQFSLLADEGKESYEFCFKTFKNLCVRDPPVLIIDKVSNVIKTNVGISNLNLLLHV